MNLDKSERTEKTQLKQQQKTYSVQETYDNIGLNFS